VVAGQLLANLDTSVLSASLAAAQAQLNNLEAPPRSVDVAGQQTGVFTAQTQLQNTYNNIPLTLETAYSSAKSAINTDTDPLFSFSTPASPVLSNINGDYTARVTVDGERAELNTEFTAWQDEIGSISATSTPDQLQIAISQSLGHLQVVQKFLSDLITAEQTPNATFTQTSQTAALAAADAALATVNGDITTVTNSSQGISTQQLAVQSAQDQLNATNAGATPEAIAAQQAAVAGIEAQIAEQEIVAPFSGTIASVSIKSGDAVSANTPAISLIPNGTFEMNVYLAENDVTKVKVGDQADVTLDAYGTSRVFPAIVGTVETSPSSDPDTATGAGGASAAPTGYKVTLVFTNADPSITNGMTGSATIYTGSAQNVLIIPTAAVITNGNQEFVLQKTSNGLVQTPVTLGITSTSTVEVLSGLSAGDMISAVGAQS
jgi:HlyD family secretion protein